MNTTLEAQVALAQGRMKDEYHVATDQLGDRNAQLTEVEAAEAMAFGMRNEKLQHRRRKPNMLLHSSHRKLVRGRERHPDSSAISGKQEMH